MSFLEELNAASDIKECFKKVLEKAQKGEFGSDPDTVMKAI
jgi:hypothetical protein